MSDEKAKAAAAAKAKAEALLKLKEKQKAQEEQEKKAVTKATDSKEAVKSDSPVRVDGINEDLVPPANDEKAKAAAAAKAKAKAAAAAKAKAAALAKSQSASSKESVEDTADSKAKAAAAAKAKAAAAAKAKAAALAKSQSAPSEESGDNAAKAKAAAAAKAKAVAAAKAKAAALAKSKGETSGESSGDDADAKAKAIAAAKAKAAAVAAAKAKAGAGKATAKDKAVEEEPSHNQPILDKYLQILKRNLDEDVLEDAYINRAAKHVPTIVVKREHYFKVAQFLKHNEQLAFDYLSTLHATDYETYMEIYNHFYSFKTKENIAMKVKIDRENPEIESLVSIWEGANWPEREMYDLLGIVFTGHPNLTRILLPDDWVGHPLRKDYEPHDEGV